MVGLLRVSLLDRHVLRLVVGQPQVAVGAQQRLLGLLQVVDRLVDLVDRGLEAPRGQVVASWRMPP
jgi:hypothetical protein